MVDAGAVAAVVEAVLADLAHEVLADFVAIQHGADPQADLGLALQAPGGDAGADRREQLFGGLQQGLARLAALGRQARVAAGHQPLVRIVRMLHDLEQADLVAALQLAGPLQLANRAATQRGDPIDAVQLVQFGQAGLHQHAAVADQHQAAQAEAPP